MKITNLCLIACTFIKLYGLIFLSLLFDFSQKKSYLLAKKISIFWEKSLKISSTVAKIDGSEADGSEVSVYLEILH